MEVEITMPQLGESVTEGIIGKWLVQEGDTINQYDPVCEVTTDKVNAEIPCTVAGKIVKIIAQEGETIGIGEPLCLVETASVPLQDSEVTEVVTQQSTVSNKNRQHQYSPVVRRLAKEHHVPLESLQGSGHLGRITKKDVLNYLNTQIKQTEQTEQTFNFTHTKRVPITPIRRLIARKMQKSKQENAHAWTTIEVDVTSLVAYREKVKSKFFAKEGFTLTYFPFFVHAVAEILKKYPQINAEWDEDYIIQKEDVHLSIAIASDQGLLVPVLRHADEKSLLGIARDLHKLINKAKHGKLNPEDVEGGTFTVNNTGAFGSILSMPIINFPQAAILTVEAIVKRPVVIQNMIAIRDMVNLCISIDHRLLDGFIVGQFLADLKKKLESYGEDECDELV